MHPVAFNTTFQMILNLIGTFVFAMSGALLAVRKGYDIVGMVVLAEITAIGGGILRDLLLGATPPAAFTDHISLLLPIAAAILTFFAHAQISRNRIQTAVLVFDAAGLAVFCVIGVTKALAYGLGPVEAIALGTLTAVGGGIMRDVLANEQPAILRADSKLYAVPAVLGATIVVLMLRFNVYSSLAASVAVIFVFVLRIASLWFGWTAPRPKRTGKSED
jgi:uncharacterized membrane protein YeiH